MTLCFAYSELNPYAVPTQLVEVIEAEAWRWTIQPLVEAVDDHKRTYLCQMAMLMIMPIIAIFLACQYKTNMNNTLKYHGEKQCREGNWKFYDERPVFRWENGYLYVDVEMVNATHLIAVQAVPVGATGYGGAVMGGGAVIMGGGVYIG